MPNIKHAFTSPLVDAGDPDEVGPNEWNAEHVIDGYLDIPEYAGVPPAPATGNVRVYCRDRAGRHLFDMVGPSGIDVSLQPAFFGNNIVLWMPGSGTTVSIALGTTWTARNSGTSAAQAHPSPSSTNALTAMRRATFGTGTTATGSSGIQGSVAQFWRGNSATAKGGFFFFARFGIETWGAGTQFLVGLSALNAALAGEPSAQNNTIAVGIDSTDTNIQVISRGTTATKIDTGVAPTNGQIFDFYAFCPPHDGVSAQNITVRLVDPVNGTVVVENQEITTNLPAATTFLYPHAQIRSTAGTTAKLLALQRMYIESDI